MRALIIDDERLARQELRRLLAPHGDVHIIAEAATADEALEKNGLHQPDLLFLDIEMPGKNAFGMLEELERTPMVIFTTAYDAFAVKAFELNALDYLLKPIDPERLSAALDRVRRSQRRDSALQPTERRLNSHDRIFVRDRERCWFVALQDIVLFESEGNYTRLYFNSHTPLVLRSLQYLEERLDAERFFRAGRKHIINMDHIKTLHQLSPERLRVVLSNDISIDMSRRQSMAFREKMSL